MTSTLQLRKIFNFDLDQMQQLRKDISHQMELGLDKAPGGLMMLPSFVDMLPTGYVFPSIRIHTSDITTEYFLPNSNIGRKLEMCMLST